MRDIDILKNIKAIEVGLTITSTLDSVSRFLEVAAPNVELRLKTLKMLNDSGIKTYAFLGPLLPHFYLYPSQLESLISAVAATGTKEVYIEHINLSNYIFLRMKYVLKQAGSDVENAYIESRTQDYRDTLEKIILGLLDKYGLKLRMKQILYHNNLKQ